MTTPTHPPHRDPAAGAWRRTIPHLERVDVAQLVDGALEHSHIGMHLTTPDGVYRWVNQAFTELVDRTSDELLGRHWRSITHRADAHLDDLGEIDDALRSGRERHFREVKRFVLPDGTLRWGSISITPLFAADTPAASLLRSLGLLGHDADGDRPIVFLGQVFDVTGEVEATAEARRAREELGRTERRLRSLAEAEPQAVLRLAVDGRVLGADDVAQARFTLPGVARLDGVGGSGPGGGPHLDQVLPGTAASRIVDELGAVVERGTDGTIPHERIATRDGDASWFAIGLLPVTGREAGAVDLVLTDLTSTMERDRRDEALVLTDSLTGVSNRAGIIARLRHALDRLARRNGSGLAVVALDVDHLTSVNDAFGQAVGDSTLRSLPAVLDRQLRAADSLGRLSGDAFLVVLEDVATAEHAREVAERLRAALNPFDVELSDGQRLPVRASLGMVWVPGQRPVDDVVQAADRALFEAKRRGRGRLHTAPAAELEEDARGLSRELLAALRNREFTLHYQPIVDDRRRVRGVEALLRWQHPQRGLLTPDRFIDNLITSGQIGPVGAWAIERAVGQLARWDEQGAPGLTMHVNACPAELAHPSFAAHLARVLADHPIDPTRLVIEVTEQALEGALVSTSVLRDVATLGPRIVLDDFGTGVSSVTHLRTDPLDGIKIDRSFISHSASGDIDRRIVSGLIGLAHEIGVGVTAEGVETDEQAEWIASTGCEHQQGWFFGRPMPPEEILAVAVA